MRYDVLSRKINNDADFKQFIYDKTNFLNCNATNVQRLWHYINNIYIVPKCKLCDKEVEFKIAGGVRKGYKLFCDDSCRATFLNLNKSEQERLDRKEKIKQTCLDKYGVEHFFSLDEVKDKKVASYIEKYGVDNPSKLSFIKQKKEKTCLKNYGVTNPSKNAYIHSKKTKNTSKIFVMPSGRKINVQGYEHHALNNLIDFGYLESDILVGKEILDFTEKIEFIFEQKANLIYQIFLLKVKNFLLKLRAFIGTIDKNN